MTNKVLIFGLLFETCVAIIILYIRPIQIGLGTRALACAHFAVPAFLFFPLLFFYDETRRIYVRKGIDRSVPGKVKYRGWIARNTLW